MKEILSAFGSEVFRPLVTIVLPGATVITPGFVALVWSNPYFSNLIAGSRFETAAVLILSAVFLGLVCDDLGTHLETLWDRHMPSTHMDNWYLYLRQAFRVEPVGHRYLRTLVLHLKFELGSSLGSTLAIIGVWWWPTTYRVRGIATAVLLVFALYLAFEAKQSHKVLSRTREEILKGIDVIPAETSDADMGLIPGSASRRPTTLMRSLSTGMR